MMVMPGRSLLRKSAGFITGVPLGFGLEMILGSCDVIPDTDKRALAELGLALGTGTAAIQFLRRRGLDRYESIAKGAAYSADWVVGGMLAYAVKKSCECYC